MSGGACKVWRRRALCAAALAFAAFGEAPVLAAASLPYASAPGSMYVGWTQPVLVVAEGTSVTYTNLDVAMHDIVSPAKGPDEPYCKGRFEPGQCPLVYSATIGLGESTPVLGLHNLRAGWQVPFFCTLHQNMRGTIVVTPAVR